jgi:DNA-binding NarL/FixJ family response regulator
MPTRILLAEDHLIVRQGLRALLEREGFTVVGEAADGREAVRMVQQLHPDVAVLDLSMPSLNGIDAAKEILQACPKTKTILLTVHAEDQYVLPAMRAGITGYVLKTKAAADLVQAIHEVSRGMTYLSPGVSGTVVQAYLAKTDLPTDPLSSRERQVLQLIAEGKTTKEVAGVLGVSVKTAESHRTRIMEKLDIHETASLVRYAIRRGLIEP